jgi:hypothetical protein
VLRVSASSGEGLEAWHRWVRLQVQQQLAVTAPGGAPALVTA